jgi:chemotaxis response regulator CheB
MRIKVLIADDSEIIFSPIRRILAGEPRIEVVGHSSSFVATMRAVGDFKPDILLLDLHWPDERDFAPEFVKSQLRLVPHVIAMSFSVDTEAKALAESYGAAVLLDKTNLYREMIPAILDCVEWEETGADGVQGFRESLAKSKLPFDSV